MKSVKRITRYSVNQFTRLAVWAKRNQRARVKTNGKVKLNLGCGLQVASGWINVDGSLNAMLASGPKWILPAAYNLSGSREFYSKEFYCNTLSSNVFVHHDLQFGIPFADQTADFVYSSHFLEHLSRTTGRRLLQECFRVLKENGVVRIAVPDLEYAWEMYRRGDKEQMIHDFFFMEDETGLGQHRYAYDYELLSTLLAEIGFERIERAKFQRGATPDLELLDNREDCTLFVEAVRPIR